jgi:hypothetical protein
MLFSNIFLPTALLAAQAAAHGAVTSYVIDGVTYPGYAKKKKSSQNYILHHTNTFLSYTGFSPASSPKTIQR